MRVEHLLSHTSGLGSYFNVAEETLAFEPGTKWHYSNTGFLLAGAVIKGHDYFDVVREAPRGGRPDPLRIGPAR